MALGKSMGQVNTLGGRRRGHAAAPSRAERSESFALTAATASAPERFGAGGVQSHDPGAAHNPRGGQAGGAEVVDTLSGRPRFSADVIISM